MPGLSLSLLEQEACASVAGGAGVYLRCASASTYDVSRREEVRF